MSDPAQIPTTMLFVCDRCHTLHFDYDRVARLAFGRGKPLACDNMRMQDGAVFMCQGRIMPALGE